MNTVELAAKLGISEAELKQIGKAAYQTYQKIGPDLRTERGRLWTQDEIIEIVLDADHIVMNCGDMLTGREKRALRHTNRYKVPDPLVIYLRDYVFTSAEYE